MRNKQIKLLAHANTHGKKFFATGGVQTLLAREDQLVKKEKLKKTLQLNTKLAKKGMAIFGGEGGLF